MKASDIFAGPILRRAQQDFVAIWVATTGPHSLVATVRKAGSAEWFDTVPGRTSIEVFPNLWVHLLTVTFAERGVFPTQTLLEYAIAELRSDGTPDFTDFPKIVAEDKLAYDGFTLPSFYLQARGSALVALYGSCRKPHDIKGSDDDALAAGDDLIAAEPKNLSSRPAILCLGGDQIYADDVHPVVLDRITALAPQLGATAENLPSGMALPTGSRQNWLQKNAMFTSDEADNHLVTFAEYVGMYGLTLNRAHWPATVSDVQLKTFVEALPKVRRLLANTPTYMIFDDHDVTDDWNLSVRWTMEVKARPLGKRIVANALCAYWLFQGWGNDPDSTARALADIRMTIARRTTDPGLFEDYFWGMTSWEFFTPTYPFVYFLNTRTQRGTTGGANSGGTGAPAYLRDVVPWRDTVRRINELLMKQGRDQPIVLVAPAPVFGFRKVDDAQAAVTAVAGPYYLDFEGWAGNTRHLTLFGRLCGDSDVVILSGDVHYGYSATTRVDIFDDDQMRFTRSRFPDLRFPKVGPGSTPTYDYLYSARFLQLTSSALRNFASPLAQKAASISVQSQWYVDQNQDIRAGWRTNGDFYESYWETTPAGTRLATRKVALPVARPQCAFSLHYNDSYNAPYLERHNLGLVTIDGRVVRNSFLTNQGALNSRTWDFSNPQPWS